MFGKCLSDVSYKLYKMFRVAVGNVHTDVLDVGDGLNNGTQLLQVPLPRPCAGRDVLSNNANHFTTFVTAIFDDHNHLIMFPNILYLYKHDKLWNHLSIVSWKLTMHHVNRFTLKFFIFFNKSCLKFFKYTGFVNSYVIYNII